MRGVHELAALIASGDEREVVVQRLEFGVTSLACCLVSFASGDRTQIHYLGITL
ncbi:hypothetical protein D3C72_2096600 [compost metagenome]